MRLFIDRSSLPCVTYKYYERCEECKTRRAVVSEISFCNWNETVELLKESTLEDLLQREQRLLQDSTDEK